MSSICHKLERARAGVISLDMSQPEICCLSEDYLLEKDTANSKVTKLQLTLALHEIRERLAEEDAEDARLCALPMGENIK